MFFEVKVLGLPVRVDVDFYPNGSTCVTATLDGIGHVLSIPSDRGDYDYLTFDSAFDVHEGIDTDCFTLISKSNSLLGDKQTYTYRINLAHIEIESPGTLIESLIKEHGINKSNLHNLLNVSHMTVFRVLNQNDNIKVSLALKLGRLFSIDPDIFLAFQRNYDLIHVLKTKMYDEIKKVNSLKNMYAESI